MKPWYIYIVKCIDNTLYTGITTDIDRRILEHNSIGLGAKYTRSRQPVELIYLESCKSRSIASKREYAIKKLKRIEKLSLIQDYKDNLK